MPGERRRVNWSYHLVRKTFDETTKQTNKQTMMTIGFRLTLELNCLEILKKQQELANSTHLWRGPKCDEAGRLQYYVASYCEPEE